MLSEIFRQLDCPSCEYRGAPFWSWNGKLAPEPLRRQIRVMKQMGMGGFFMHSRTGLATAYLGEEWFECVAACVDEAATIGMRAWLYDEDRYASGAAGGMVTKDVRFRRRMLDLNVYDSLEDYEDKDCVVGLYLAGGEGMEFRDIVPIAQPPKALACGQRILQAYMSIEECSSWFNHYTYPDLLNPEAVKRFRDITHREYERRFKEHFGTVIPGIFTDEPNYMSHMRTDNDPFRMGTLPWTERFPEAFLQRHGHELDAILPLAFSNAPGAARAKWEYYDCASHLFCESFAKILGQWCEANGLEHTGHLLLEDTPSAQTTYVGSTMRFYEYMQAPGIDVLTQHNKIYDTAKQCSSAANQFGRRWRLSETYGVTGWDFPFAGHKALSDWQAALGINLRCHHLYHYTLLGRAKRDYPASIGHQSPWYREYPLVEDYYARINLFLSHGRTRCDILCIHPIESAFAAHDDPSPARHVDRAIVRTRNRLLTAHLDFDYGDEDLLARYGVAEDGLLGVVRSVYRAVVVPGALTLRSTTLELLRDFRDQGGLVVFADPANLPGMLDARPSDAVRQFAAGCGTFEQLDSACRNLSVRDEQGQEIAAILYQRREYDADSEAVFLCNTSDSDALECQSRQRLVQDRTEKFDRATISIQSEIDGRLIEITPETGEAVLTPARNVDGWYTVETSFDVLQSRLFAITRDPGVIDSLEPEVVLETLAEAEIGPEPFRIQRDEPNVLVLDRAEYRIAGGPWQGSTEILSIDTVARAFVGIPTRSDRMAQPWTETAEKNPGSVKVELRYSFEIAELPENDLTFVIEQPERYTLKVNGKSHALRPDTGCWIDESMRTVALSCTRLRKGTNTLRLTTRIDRHHPGLEAVFLLGEFGVDIDGLDLTVTKAPDQLEIGNWTEQGLPFYSASVTYRSELTVGATDSSARRFVRFPAVDATCVSVLVNGQKAGTCAWAPWEVEITDLLRDGSNELQFVVCSHRRNSMGPLYHDSPSVGPNSFLCFSGQYTLSPCGLQALPRLVTRRATS